MGHTDSHKVSLLRMKVIISFIIICLANRLSSKTYLIETQDDARYADSPMDYGKGKTGSSVSDDDDVVWSFGKPGPNGEVPLPKGWTYATFAPTGEY